MIKSILEMLICGGPVMIPIFIVSLVIWTLIIGKYRRLKKEDINQGIFTDKIISFLQKGEKKKIATLSSVTPGILSRTVKALADDENKTRKSLLNIVQEIMHEEYPRLEKNLSTIASLASVAPLLGLLGTVSGMVATFDSITIFGTGDPQSLAKGISQALITTQSGLIIAIPALFSHNHLMKKVNQQIFEFEKNINKIINILTKGDKQ